MKIGLVGYQGSGKSTLFEWLTGVQARSGAGPRFANRHGRGARRAASSRCAAIYHPKKITLASLELVDTAGLSRTHEGNAARLAADSRGRLPGAGRGRVTMRGGDPLGDVARLDEDFLLADLEIVSGRIERLRESTKKPRPNRDAELAELAALEPTLAALESRHAAGGRRA